MLSDTMMLGGGRKAAYSIENALLFRGGQYLSRTPSVAGDGKRFTLSMWFRRGGLGSSMGYRLFSTYRDSRITGNACFNVGLDSTGQLLVSSHGWQDAPPIYFAYNTKRKFLDTGAWYHLVVVVDTAHDVASERVRIYVNGERETGFLASPFKEAAVGQQTDMNRAGMAHFIGRYWDQGWVDQQTINAHGSYFDGEFAEVCVVDGGALEPGKFGAVDPVTKSWRPVKLDGIDFGPNGFHLGKPWASAALGADASGRGNTWTPEGFAATDVVKDTPTNVYATLTPLWQPTGNSAPVSVSSGGLKAVIPPTNSSARATHAVTSGKWYWEARFTTLPNYCVVGVARGGAREPWGEGGVQYVNHLGLVYSDGVPGPSAATWSSADLMGVALDLEAKTVTFYKNGVQQLVVPLPVSASGWTPLFSVSCATASAEVVVNFGQKGWEGTPPAGFQALCTANLPTPARLAAKQPWKYYACKTFTTTGGVGSFSIGWNPDPANGGSHTLFRIKRIEDVSNWWWIDTVRGLDKVLSSDSTAAENTITVISSVSANGTVNVSLVSGYTYLIEAWRVAPEAGFDILTWTGDGTSNRQIGHALGSVPAFGTVKCRDTNSVNNTWLTQHTALDANYYLILNDPSGQTPISSTHYGALGTFTNAETINLAAGSVDSRNVNEDGKRYVAYVWSEVPGFSRFGSYTGNGSTDGPFVHLGFAPAEFTGKRVDGSSAWGVQCLAMDNSNPVQAQVYLNQGNASDISNDVDFLSNGVKLRNSTSWNNFSGGSYVTAAWAAHPLGAKRITPATAR